MRVGILVFFLVPLSAILLKFICWNSINRWRETDVQHTNLHSHLFDCCQPQLVASWFKLKYSFNIVCMKPMECFKWRDGPCTYAAGPVELWFKLTHVLSLPSLWFVYCFRFAVCKEFQVTMLGESNSVARGKAPLKVALVDSKIVVGNGRSHESARNLLLRMPSYWVQATGRFQLRKRRVHQGCQVCSILVKQGSTIQHKQGSVILQGSMFTLHTLTLLYSQPKVDSNMDVGQVAICYLFSIILVVLRHKPFSHKGVQREFI